MGVPPLKVRFIPVVQVANDCHSFLVMVVVVAQVKRPEILNYACVPISNLLSHQPKDHCGRPDYQQRA